MNNFCIVNWCGEREVTKALTELGYMDRQTVDGDIFEVAFFAS